NAQIGIDNITAVPTVMPGDFNRDGHVNVADIQAMMNALADESGYKSFWGLTSDQLNLLGDFNADNAVTNTDLQGLIDTLANGGGTGSLSAVPEPASWTLCAVFAPALLMLHSLGARNSARRYPVPRLASIQVRQ